MNYVSTRTTDENVSSAKAILTGIASGGGLYVPTEIPKLTDEDFKKLFTADYIERAKLVLSKYLTDFTAEELDKCVKGAYLGGKFDNDIQAPLHKLNDTDYVLELWHGPTCAFKDMALQLLPHLLTESIKKEGDGSEIVILVATSGDTGKAALEGFKDVKGTRILVFYPVDGVSQVQKRQMITQEGSNVGVCAINGNFDDAQTGVKRIFTDSKTIDELKANKMAFSSANSINWGRLVPQIVYYVSAYCDMVKSGAIKEGETFNVVVPTGNFGNILAAYFAKKMGTPIGKLICASNSNNVLTDFIKTGTYDRNREFYTTISPSMDILISSNLERLLYLLSDGDSKYTASLMSELNATGSYTVSKELKEKLDKDFVGGFADEGKTKATINRIFNDYGYLCDTHTAVALSVYEDYKKSTGDNTKTVIASTANPYKFVASVLGALKGGDIKSENEFQMVSELMNESGVVAPKQLTELENKQPRFTEVVNSNDMRDYVLKTLNID